MNTETQSPHPVGSSALFGALADQLKRSKYKWLPLPYVWWHDYRKDWWLSTESGSRAIGTFEEAVAALAAVAPNTKLNHERSL